MTPLALTLVEDLGYIPPGSFPIREVHPRKPRTTTRPSCRTSRRPVPVRARLVTHQVRWETILCSWCRCRKIRDVQLRWSWPSMAIASRRMIAATTRNNQRVRHRMASCPRLRTPTEALNGLPGGPGTGGAAGWSPFPRTSARHRESFRPFGCCALRYPPSVGLFLIAPDRPVVRIPQK